jgi:hypothetical membrane protein
MTPPAKAVPGGLAAAGVAGPILFMVVLLAQDVLRSDYDPLAVGLSPPRVGPYGWVQSVNFVVLGLLLIAFAVGLHLGVRPARAGVVGPAIVAWDGVALVVAGAFPLRTAAEGFGYQPNAVYGLNNTIFGLSLGIGPMVLSRRLARDASWHDLASYVLATGITVLLLSVGTGVLAGSHGGQVLAPWYGLLRRVTVAAWLMGIVIVALRLRRLARPGVTDSFVKGTP